MFKELFTEAISFSKTYSDLQKKIKGAKKSDCDSIEKEIIKLHKDRKLTSDEFSELEADISRKKQSLNESDYEIYHDSYSSAIKATEMYAKKNGYTTDPEEYAEKVGLGPAKPKPGKTNKFSITLYKGDKPQKKMLQIQIYNRETKSNEYELNMYIR